MQQRGALYPKLDTYVESLFAELGQIPAQRVPRLEELAEWVQQRLQAEPPARLTFICTHNSRRSHLAQIWAQTAAYCFGVTGIETYSGGTEATAFNPRAVAALARAGFRIAQGQEPANPVYQVRFNADSEPMPAFSKVYDQPPNPRQGFAAIMTCTAADAACPLVYGADTHIAIPYEDPKAFDGTGQEAAKYDERCRQIAAEMLLLLSMARG